MSIETPSDIYHKMKNNQYRFRMLYLIYKSFCRVMVLMNRLFYQTKLDLWIRNVLWLILKCKFQKMQANFGNNNKLLRSLLLLRCLHFGFKCTFGDFIKICKNRQYGFPAVTICWINVEV